MQKPRTMNYSLVPSSQGIFGKIIFSISLPPMNLTHCASRWYPFSQKSYDCGRGIIKFIAPRNLFDFLDGVKLLLPYALSTMLNRWEVPGAPPSKGFSWFLPVLIVSGILAGGGAFYLKR